MRKLDKKTRSELRQIAVSAVLSMPTKNISKVAKQYKLRRETLSQWIISYRKSGKRSFMKDGRGAKKWQHTALSKRQENWVRKIVINKYPEQMQLPFMLWNKGSIRDLIEQKFEQKLGLTTISRLLAKWNMTPQKPILKAYKQQPEELKKWIDTEYPRVKEEAKSENASIYWCDETSISSRELVAKGFSIKGETPTLKVPASRFSVNMVAAIANQGETKFMIFEKNMNSKVFIEFLRRLTKEQTEKSFKKIYLILDNMSVHKAKSVKAWEKKHVDKIKLIYLPPYAPEHNPTEYLNQTLKIKLKNRPKDKTRSDLRKSVSTEMKSLQNNKKTIRSLFDAPKVRYARD